MKMSSLHDLYVEQLKDLYSAEGQFLKCLPALAERTSSDPLKGALEDLHSLGRVHVDRLEQIFMRLEEAPTGNRCKGMEGLIAEGRDLLGEDADPAVLDAGVIGSVQRTLHYEIASYGCVRTYAELLGDAAAVDALGSTLDEEVRADRALTELAERVINVTAVQDPAGGP